MRPGDEPDRKIERALEGALDAKELAALQAEVVRDPALRAAYAERAWMHAMLRAERDRLPQWLEGDAPGAAPVLRWKLAAAVLAAAACAVFGWSWLRPVSAPRAEQIATLVETRNARWAGSTLPTAERAPLGRGTLALVEGIATLKFASGAVVTLEAPTKLEILSAMHCRLIEGSVTADVPESAHGFTVDTSDLKVVDIGTRFGVTAGSAGNSHVFVFEGEVTLQDYAGSKPRSLLEGKSFHVNSGPGAIETEPARFATAPPVDGWMSVPTSFGRGRDGYARRGDQLAGAPQPLLLVKHTELELSRKNERRAVMTFDLSEVRTAEVKDVELVLDPEPSGLGFSAMVLDATFAVYGVTDETLDAWDDKALRWGTMPACEDAGPNPAQVRRLAGFALPRGASGQPLTVGGGALADFVRGDTNGLVTLLLVRETGETDPSGLVHAFASRAHPSARPPTLRVR